MDKYETRRLRLKELIDEKSNGVIARFAELIDRDASYVSRMLYPPGKSGRKRIADDMIELIEKKLNLPRGWFDFKDKLGSGNWPFSTVTYEEFKALPDFDKKEIETLMHIKVHRTKK